MTRLEIDRFLSCDNFEALARRAIKANLLDTGARFQNGRYVARTYCPRVMDPGARLVFERAMREGK